jgi:hypothetical protein
VVKIVFDKIASCWNVKRIGGKHAGGTTCLLGVGFASACARAPPRCRKIGDRIFGKSADEFFTAPNLPKIFYNGGIFIFSFIIIYYPLDFSTTGEFL